MYYCGWEKRTDGVTNTTPAIRYTKMYCCGWKKRTYNVTNTAPAILYTTIYYCGWNRGLAVLQTLNLQYITLKCTTVVGKRGLTV